MALALPQPEPNSPQAADPTPVALRRGDGRSSAQEAARRGCAVVGCSAVEGAGLEVTTAICLH
jgi:hypothetical protein